jgi:hypothetical protein
VATGEVTDPDEVLIDYGDDEWEALPVLRGVTEVARRAGMARAGLSDYLRARSPRRPPVSTESRLRAVATALVADGVARPCGFAGCSAWARPLPSTTCTVDASNRRRWGRRPFPSVARTLGRWIHNPMAAHLP